MIVRWMMPRLSARRIGWGSLALLFLLLNMAVCLAAGPQMMFFDTWREFFTVFPYWLVCLVLTGFIFRFMIKMDE